MSEAKSFFGKGDGVLLVLEHLVEGLDLCGDLLSFSFELIFPLLLFESGYLSFGLGFTDFSFREEPIEEIPPSKEADGKFMCRGEEV